MLSFPASHSVENHVLAAFEGFRGDFEGGLRFVLLVGFCPKQKTMAKFVENRKYYRSPLLLQARIMLDPFSSDFKTIVKGSSFLGLRSPVFSLCTNLFFMTSSKIC